MKYLIELLNKNPHILAARDVLIFSLSKLNSQEIIFITGNKDLSSNTLHPKVEVAK